MNSSLLHAPEFRDIWPNFEKLNNNLLNFESVNTTDWQYGIADVYKLCAGSRELEFRSEVNLHNAIRKYIEKYVEKLMKKLLESGDERIFELYSKSWNDFKDGTRYVNVFYSNLNSTLLSFPSTDKKLPTVQMLFYEVFCDKILTILQADLIRLLRQIIERDRRGDDISLNQIAMVVDSFVEMSSLKSDDTLQFYKDAFELPFLEWTEEYYKKLANDLISSFDCSQYMEKILKLMERENDRSRKYLHPISFDPVVETLRRVLVAEKLDFLMPNLKIFIESESLKDLSNMYVLIKPLPQQFKMLIKEFETYVTTKGLELIKNLYENVKKDNMKEMVRMFFDNFTNFYNHYSKIIRERFQSDIEFVSAFDRACVLHVNFKNAQEKCPHASRLLSFAIDGFLRKSAKLDSNEDKLEQNLVSATILFRYIDDKDIFQRYFSERLANRLINSDSSSIDAEASMITKLKETCGLDFARKPQQMFTDLNMSTDTNEKFAEFSKGLDLTLHKSLNIIVCQSGAWPFNIDPSVSALTLPLEFVPFVDNFDLFFKSKQSGRKLNWLHHLSRVEVAVNYLPSQYFITMNFWHACILFMYNETKSDSITFQEFTNRLGLDDDRLTNYLNAFLECGLLKKINCTTDAYKLNTEFKSRRIKFNLRAPPTTKQVEKEVEQVNTAAEKERKILIECKIVQIMKTRQILNHIGLITEVISQTKSRFQANPSVIKHAIESLIDKEYLERSEDNRDLYKYKA